MSPLVDVIDRLGQQTESEVLGRWASHRRGELDERTFVDSSAEVINRAKARATGLADRSVAAEVTKQTGRPARPVGIKPIDDRPRLRESISNLIHDKPKTARTPAELEESRRGRLGRMARNEPATAAQNASDQAMSRQPVMGWVRALGGSGVCPLCEKWADGVVRSTKVKMVRHKGCRCMPRPVAKEDVTRAAEAAAKAAARKAAKEAAKRGAARGAQGLAAAYGGRQAIRYVRRLRRGPEPTIFQRIDEFERHLRQFGISLNRGEYMVHGSGLLDALNIRVAGDLDVIADPDLYERVALLPGWRKLQAGVLKDVEILSNPKLNMQIAKALPSQVEQLRLPLAGIDLPAPRRRQITVDDLLNNTVTIQGREFIRPELLAEMKAAAVREGAKVPKNIRDLALLEGRFTWAEDVRRFGDLLNRSPVARARDVNILRHPAMGPTTAERAGTLAGIYRRRAHRTPQRTIATVAERRALQRYGRGSFELNRRLREGIDLSDFDRRQVELIDRALAKQRTPHRIKVYRGLRLSRREALDLYGDKIDTIVREPSFMSTGLREKVARKYGQSGVYLELDVPPGAPGYYAPYRALSPANLPEKFYQAFGEDELLLPRNLSYRILDIVERSDGTILIKAEVIPTALQRAPLPGLEIRAQVPGRPSAPRISVATPARTVRGVVQRLLAPGVGPRMRLELIPDPMVAKIIARQAKVPGFEDLARRTGRGALEGIIDRQTGFILQWAQRSWELDPAATRLHANWYPFAHGWLNDLADANPNNGITRAGAYAVTAALSPRADWANNVAWAKRVIEAISEDVVVDARWIEAIYQRELELGRALDRKGGRPRRRVDLVGKRLSQIRKDDDVAYVLRGWHEHEPLRQLGGRAGFGDPRYLAAPNDMGNITKAVSVARNGSLANIDATLGGMKVRSFYNNLANPFDDVDLNVTVDTHHFGVANGFAWTASHPFMSSGTANLTDTPWSDPIGMGGTYPLVVEATRRATVIFNDLYGTDFLPNQIQSIVWEMHRALYPGDYRTDTLLRRMEAIRTARARRRITLGEEDRLIEQARLRVRAPRLREILAWFQDDLAGRPRRPLQR